MAVILPKGKLRGISGPIYYRTLNGREIFQTRPDRSNQKKENNTYAILFKKVVSSLKVLRLNIAYFLGDRQDSKVHQRLTGQTITALKKHTTQAIEETSIFNTSLRDLIGFDWNVNSPFNHSFTSEIIGEQLSDTTLRINVKSFIPAQSVVFPIGCTHATLRLELCQLNSKNIKISNIHTSRSIDFQQADSDPIGCKWDIEHLATDVFTMAVVELQFFYPINGNPNQLTLYNSKAFNPSMIVYVSDMQRE